MGERAKNTVMDNACDTSLVASAACYKVTCFWLNKSEAISNGEKNT